ncbi:large subunit ribosomal protein L37e_2, cytoplasmic type [Guillardia theta CCMP2712]|uniref:Large subunit ribosomal protein L37e_2, cytoplasmic type n=1 Tax=Guillardia theta (strain CCMP2712) TaxID=905079 RepID=L1JIT2_GUITC|nr:large subunit ribosomal protein L37e_2, cytoplasmic type [Guillardia theta CCMP2712]EKX48428.1 large subunit ribosomal protein L37e_2, cytoplasmic type [Guillardia theta CCMP2712]|eukprot:XP_005835408.1 large subunit ribosomal protein L37e_2, cytoplasmic type [Guillardia theta CCMP2712]
MANMIPNMLLVLVSLVASSIQVASASDEKSLPSQLIVCSSNRKSLITSFLQSSAHHATLVDHMPSVLRLSGGKKGTASQGKHGTGAKSHPGYKYHMSYPRKSRHSSQKMKRYTLKKNPEGMGRRRHMKKVFARFKTGFRSGMPFTGRIKKVNES